VSNPLYDALFGRNRENPAPFLHLPQGHVESHAAFAARADAMAGVLGALGLAPGDRLAVQAPKSPDALALYAACLQAGVIYLPLNTAYTPAEIGYFLDDATPRLLVADPGTEDALRPLAEARGVGFETMDATGGGSLPGRARAARPRADAAPRAPDDVAVLLYTSGTTGRSKGAMLTQENLLSNARALCHSWQITEADRLLHALPIYHAHGLFVAVNTTALAGASMLLLPGLDADAVIAALPGATTMMGVPTFYTRLLDNPRFDRDLVAHMRLFVSGSAPLLPETHRAFAARSGHAILERYGMTETGMNASNPYQGERRPGSVGFALPGVSLRVTDPATGANLPSGETGMVEVKGPNVFAGYWNLPEKTAEEMRPGGWFVTGDLGRFDADGYLHIVGRQKDLVISGGLNVYPVEVEAALDAQPGVRESAVIGVPHPDFGEAVVGIIVPEGDMRPDAAGITAALGRELARFKQPKRLILVEELPRNTMGKVQKNRLRELYRDLFVAGTGGT